MRLYQLLFFIALIVNLPSSFSQSNKSVFQREDVFQLEHASSPQISKDGNQIVYIRNRMDIMIDRKVGSLWIINADGSNHRKLTNREKRESSPSWSPVAGDDRP